jgi:hypothetical protein
LKRIQVKMNPRKPFETITNIVDAKTFAPIMSESKVVDGSFWHREFNGSVVQGQQKETPGGKIEEIRATFETPVFDFYGGLYGLLLATFPLKEGYSATFPSDFQNNDGVEAVEWVTFHVKGKETISTVAGKQVETWLVENDAPQGHYQFWLSQQAPYIIKLIYTGPRGGKQIFEMM